MPPLADELKQSRPFAGLEVEAYLNLLRTADRLRRETAELLRPHALSPTGYNVLRILRGAGVAGLPCAEVAARLVSHDPDITRLADRLADTHLLTRERRSRDRRLVVLRITPEGLALLVRLDGELVALHRRQLSHLGEEGLDQLIALCELIRACPSAERRGPTSPQPTETA